MGSNSAEGEPNHVIQIWEVSQDRLDLMQQKISQDPCLLSIEAGKNSCCIFRVPRGLADSNGKSYRPRICSVGPYHRGEDRCRMIEEHKWRYLGSLLSRTQNNGLLLQDYLKALAPIEMKARQCYSEKIYADSAEFIEMMVLDGCFIVELFRKVGKVVPFEPDDPLISMSWILPFLYRDFISLENQIPFFVLEKLFELTRIPGEESGKSLSLLALEFFNNVLLRPDEVLLNYHDLKGKHLLDFLRLSFIPSPEEKEPPKGNTPSNIIHCVSKLRQAGIKIKPGQNDSFLVVKFRHGVIEMPTITIDDFMSSFLINCVAYEQCHKDCSIHMTTYCTLLDCLVNTTRDVEYLCDRNIIENYFGTDLEIAHLLNDLGKDVAFDIESCYLAKLFKDVHQYYGNNWHVQWASFKYTYFDTPWSFISALAAFILLLLTMAQTFYTIYPEVK